MVAIHNTVYTVVLSVDLIKCRHSTFLIGSNETQYSDIPTWVVGMVAMPNFLIVRKSTALQPSIVNVDLLILHEAN